MDHNYLETNESMRPTNGALNVGRKNFFLVKTKINISKKKKRVLSECAAREKEDNRDGEENA